MDRDTLTQRQLALRERPPGRAVMLQRWRSLLFLHTPIEPEHVQRRLPKGLTVETFPDEEGRDMAWIGFVPFRMEGVRPTWMPEISELSDFAETNVRTYVHRDGEDPGVWFFSLDAAQWCACVYARKRFGLPYFFAEMAVEEKGDLRIYRSERLWGSGRALTTALISDPLPSPEPGTLEFFLVERYLLHSVRKGKLWTGRVHHTPYPLRRVTGCQSFESLIGEAGLPPRLFSHHLFSDGVDVEIFPLRPVPD